MFRTSRSRTTVDGPPSKLDRLRKLTHGKTPMERIVAVKELVDTAYDVGFKAALQHVLPLVKTLSRDTDSIVRRALLEIVSGLAAFLIQSEPEKGYRHVLDLVDLVGRLLATDMYFAADSLLQLAPQLRVQDRTNIALLQVLGLAQHDDPQRRQLSAHMITSLSPSLPPELKEAFCVVQLIALSDDAVSSVRIAVIKQLSEFASNVQATLIKSRILPCYQTLCGDLIYQVRRAACENLSTFALSCGVENVPLENMITQFLDDKNPFVNSAALHQLGYCLGIMETIPDSLLQQYLSVSLLPCGDDLAEPLSFHCAYVFSQVFHCLGKDYWSRLKPSLASLIRSQEVSVRKTLASSLHRVAMTLGEDASSELYPIFQTLANDANHEVVGALVKHLGQFIEHVKPRCGRYLHFLKNILCADYWRLRETLAMQLGFLVVDEDVSWAYVLPAWLHLCKDEFLSVRFAAIEQSGTVFHGICKEENSNRTRRLVTHLIDEFARSPHWQKRSTFIKMTYYLLRPLKPWCIATFAPDLACLGGDKISGVRITWAQWVGPQIKSRARLGTQEILVNRGLALKNDRTPEVKRIMSSIQLGNDFTSFGEAVEQLRDEQDDLVAFYLDVAPPSTPRSSCSASVIARSDLHDSHWLTDGKFDPPSPPGSPTSTSSPTSRALIPHLLLDCAGGGITDELVAGSGLSAAEVAATELADTGIFPSATDVVLDPAFTRAALAKVLALTHTGEDMDGNGEDTCSPTSGPGSPCEEGIGEEERRLLIGGERGSVRSDESPLTRLLASGPLSDGIMGGEQEDAALQEEEEDEEEEDDAEALHPLQERGDLDIRAELPTMPLPQFVTLERNFTSPLTEDDLVSRVNAQANSSSSSSNPYAALADSPFAPNFTSPFSRERDDEVFIPPPREDARSIPQFQSTALSVGDTSGTQSPPFMPPPFTDANTTPSPPPILPPLIGTNGTLSPTAEDLMHVPTVRTITPDGMTTANGCAAVDTADERSSEATTPIIEEPQAEKDAWQSEERDLVSNGTANRGKAEV
eukprot:GEMP01002587.1.p1 GENE.GEMP01002587.1~~GEMP01002587.1.p1  ORF type:complete len:1037 (+),score=221.37 GEMP01002587.1:39-3149(+)